MQGFIQRWRACVAPLLFIVVMLSGGRVEVSAQLAMQFYANTCPNLEQIVMGTVSAISLMDRTTAPRLLRLLFHDCQVQGCDASILLNSQGPITTEMMSDKNFGVGNLATIDRVKAAVETACPRTVSCADIIALAARDAVRISGGPTIAIPLGRRDSLTASNVLADLSIPPPDISVDAMLNLFAAKGMTVEEAVAMLGGHTLGVGHCVNVVKRLYAQQDPNLGFIFGNFLRLSCPTTVPFTNATFIGNDLTFLRFDNQYFRDIRSGRGLLSIDAAIAADPRTAPVVARFASDEAYFFFVFSRAFVKLSTFRVLTGNQGQIRTNCHFVP